MNIFNKIPLLRPKRNVFNLGYENRLSSDLFRLTPIAFKEVLPDDVIKYRPEIFARVMPALNAPVMQRFDIRWYTFFVPTRIIWDDFEKWINPKQTGSTKKSSLGVPDIDANIVAPRISVSAGALANGDSAKIFGPKTLADYLGVNFAIAPELQADSDSFKGALSRIFPNESLGFAISSLPFRAYQKVYNDWFIDLNNRDLVEFSTGSGVEEWHPGDTTEAEKMLENLLEIRYRAWEHDYFTSAMPDPQRGPDVMAFDGGDVAGLEVSGSGNISVQAPLDYSTAIKLNYKDGVDASTVYQYDTPGDFIRAHYDLWEFQDEASALAALSEDGGKTFNREYVKDAGGSAVNNSAFISGAEHIFFVTYNGNAVPLSATKVIVNPGINTNVPASSVAEKLEVSGTGTAQGVTVEELRIRMQMQSFLERNEVGGPRYTEMLYAHWGVKDPDGRLQRAEFLGGGKQPLLINEISQTSAPSDDDPLGQYAGQGISSSPGREIKFRAPEHGYFIALMCIMPRTGYFQGIEPLWFRFDRLDYFWPSFAHLGEQEVKNKEVFFQGFDPNGTFGYQQRYAEYKASYDQVHGDMKGSLAFWHGARAFDTPSSADDIPKLSEEFTMPQSSGQDGIDRIFPVASEGAVWDNADHFVFDIYNHITASRRMPKFITPRNGS